MLFTKDLKGHGGHADKGCVSTLAHTMMTAARPVDSGLGAPGDLDRYPYAEAPVAERVGPPSWEGVETDLGRVGRRSTGSRGRGLHGQLVQQLGQMIVSGDLGADRPLVPEEIGQRFEVSRTVVRESLRVLEAKGLVSARPNVGTRVRPVSDWNLLDPDIIEWRAFGPQRDDQRRELNELRWTIEPWLPGSPPGTAARTSSSGWPTWSRSWVTPMPRVTASPSPAPTSSSTPC